MSVSEKEIVTDQERVRIATNFIMHSPPGEFNEVFNDVRVLLNNDGLLKEGASSALPQYNKDQLMPVTIHNSDHKSLITAYNDLGGCRFFDDRSHQSFVYDHLKKDTSDYKPWRIDTMVEPWRVALERELTDHVAKRFKDGVAAVFGKSQDKAILLNACVEHHQFQPNNFWNARWRSTWSIRIADNTVIVKGMFRVQVHYYEDGNVQLVSHKEVDLSFPGSSEDRLAKHLVQLIDSSENEYQNALSNNYQTMSDTTFKALRRQLPVTRAKIDWNKIASYTVGKKLK